MYSSATKYNFSLFQSYLFHVIPAAPPPPHIYHIHLSYNIHVNGCLQELTIFTITKKADGQLLYADIVHHQSLSGGHRGAAVKTPVSDDRDPEFKSHSDWDFFRRVSKALWALNCVLSQTDVETVGAVPYMTLVC